MIMIVKISDFSERYQIKDTQNSKKYPPKDSGRSRRVSKNEVIK